MNQEAVPSPLDNQTSPENYTEIPSCAVLRSNQIEDLVESGQLISENYDPGQVSPASYDIRLGAEFYQGGTLQHLGETEESVWITVQPLDMVYVTSYESFRLPQYMIGRYSLRLGFMYKGLVLVGGGAQVDPGYEGKLFGLLINFSEKPILLRFKDHWATIEFAPTTFDPERSKLYKDQKDNYQGATSIGQLFPASKQVDVESARAVTGALRRVWIEVQQIKEQAHSTLDEINQRASEAAGAETRIQGLLEKHEKEFEEQAQLFETRYLDGYKEGVDELNAAYDRATDRMESRVNFYAILVAIIFGLTLAALAAAVVLK